MAFLEQIENLRSLTDVDFQNLRVSMINTSVQELSMEREIQVFDKVRLVNVFGAVLITFDNLGAYIGIYEDDEVDYNVKSAIKEVKLDIRAIERGRVLMDILWKKGFNCSNNKDLCNRSLNEYTRNKIIPRHERMQKLFTTKQLSENIKNMKTYDQPVTDYVLQMPVTLAMDDDHPFDYIMDELDYLPDFDHNVPYDTSHPVTLQRVRDLSTLYEALISEVYNSPSIGTRETDQLWRVRKMARAFERVGARPLSDKSLYIRDYHREVVRYLFMLEDVTTNASVTIANNDIVKKWIHRKGGPIDKVWHPIYGQQQLSSRHFASFAPTTEDYMDVDQWSEPDSDDSYNL